MQLTTRTFAPQIIEWLGMNLIEAVETRYLPADIDDRTLNWIGCPF